MNAFQWNPSSPEDRAEFERLIRRSDIERVEQDVWAHPGATPQVQAAAMVGHYTVLMRHVANNTWHRTYDQAGDGPEDALLLLRCVSTIGTCLHNHHTVMMSEDEQRAANLLFAMCRGMVGDLKTLVVPARWHPEWTRHQGISHAIAHCWQELCRIAAHVASMEVRYGVPGRVPGHRIPEPVAYARWGSRGRAAAAFLRDYSDWFRSAGTRREPVRWQPPSERASSAPRATDGSLDGEDEVLEHPTV